MSDACNLDVLENSIVEGSCALQGPPPGAVLAPWVRVKFEISGLEITVGNESCPQKSHHAVIKDFEFGHAEGVECRITIIDELGGSFANMMEEIVHSPNCTERNTNMLVDFGWISQDCDGRTTVIANEQSYYIMGENIESNFSGGRFQFMIVGKDIGSMMFDYRHEQHYGDDKNRMYLTDALEKMLTTGTPSVSSVRFLRADDDNNPQPIIFKENGQKGREEVWYSQRTDKLNCGLTWLKDNLSNRDKTIYPVYNSEVYGGEIIFWEDAKPNCDQSRDWDQNCLGTYVVNGGNKSNVLEFNFRARWSMFAFQTGGNMGFDQPLATDTQGKMKGREDCTTISREANPETGSSSTSCPLPSTRKVFLKDAGEVAGKGQALQQKSLSIFTDPITADLVIIGDPKFLRPAQCIRQKNIKIIFLNPLYIMEGTSGEVCGDWLAEPRCNEVLTNKAWIIQSVTHRISEGRFTTTIGVTLTAPGVDTEVATPLGGPGSGGWTPSAGC